MPKKFALKYDVRGKRNQYNKVSKEIGRRYQEMRNIVVCIGNGLLSEAIIRMLKNSGNIDAFFYSSVTEKYLTAALASL